jgi:hypothetical protein
MMTEYRIGRQRIDPGDGQVKVELLGSLTEVEFDEIKRSLSKLEELHSIRRLRDFVIANDHEIMQMLNDAVNDLVAKSTHWTGVKRADIEKVFLNTNRLLLNYLTAIKTFIDHTTTFLNRKFGEQSEEFLGFKTMLSAFYDASFAYRFLSKLRNYAQHVDLPLESIHFSAKNRDNLKALEGTLTVEFDRDNLLNSFQKWGTVKADLDNMDTNKFSFTPLLYQMTHIIGDIERNVELIFKDELLIAANFIVGFISDLWEEDWGIFLAHDFSVDKAGGLTNFKQDELPLETLDFILKNLN